MIDNDCQVAWQSDEKAFERFLILNGKVCLLKRIDSKMSKLLVLNLKGQVLIEQDIEGSGYTLSSISLDEVILRNSSGNTVYVKILPVEVKLHLTI